MYWSEIRKIATAAGFLTGLATLAVKIFRGQGLLNSSYMAIVVFLISSIIYLVCMESIGRILATFLAQKQRETERPDPPEQPQENNIPENDDSKAA